jgi:hypothetical protein
VLAGLARDPTERKDVVSRFLHFQRLTLLKMAGAFCPARETPIDRRFPKSSIRSLGGARSSRSGRCRIRRGLWCAGPWLHTGYSWLQSGPQTGCWALDAGTASAQRERSRTELDAHLVGTRHEASGRGSPVTPQGWARRSFWTVAEPAKQTAGGRWTAGAEAGASARRVSVQTGRACSSQSSDERTSVCPGSWQGGRATVGTRGPAPPAASARRRCPRRAESSARRCRRGTARRHQPVVMSQAVSGSMESGGDCSDGK